MDERYHPRTTLPELEFDNRFTRELPSDPDLENSRRQVEGACFSRVQPKTVSQPQTIACSREAAALVDLAESECQTDLFAEVFSGNRLLDGMDPYAMCYGGHQFGNWAGQLGDGRAINLGEVLTNSGEHWTLQLKGAGPTPYSRNADGLAVLRSSVREFLCSEAMHHLGVPTTRALSLVLTGEKVIRDMFYDGNPQLEPGAIVCRMSPSFIRFGNFEIFSARGDIENLGRLADYTLRTEYPHLGDPSVETYLAWFEEVCSRTLEMIIHWQRVGFVHGVMNTDNMSIIGLTIDYGPYGWLEDFDPDWTPNTTDASGKRYRFANQPLVAQWNLAMLARAIYPLIEDADTLQEILNGYQQQFNRKWNRMMADKLGFESDVQKEDESLINDLLAVLQLTETDMTIFFRKLADYSVHDRDRADDELLAVIHDAFYRPTDIEGERREKLIAWIRSYLVRLQNEERSDDDRKLAMNAVNPKYVLRNYLAQLAIDKAEKGDYSMIHELLDLLRRPYDEQPEREDYAARRPDWARSRPGCSMLSCSS